MKKINIDSNKISELEKLLQGAIILIVTGLVVTVHIMAGNIVLTSTVGGFGVVILLIIFLYKIIYKKYMENTFIQLSDLLDTIINLREDPVFSTTEDTILSKLQYQIIKLTNILKAKNTKIETERNEIKALISDIAHQLKTPLTNLKMYGEFLQDDTLSEEERKEFTEVILASLNRLTFLVESMIKMSRLESGVIQLRPAINNLNETVLMAIAQIQKKAMEKEIEIKLEERSEIEISFDKNWMFEAILNILDNAVKYTPAKGEIKVRLQNYEIFSRIDIEDNGIGISEEEYPIIFKRFSRGKNVGTAEGIGIGLYLTNEIVNIHGGYVKVSSREGRTVFSVFLPRDKK